MNKMLAIIDATDKGQLDLLTIHRMPGALPFAGKFRLIDFALSNVKHASIKNVAIFPYGNYRSLGDHVGSGKRWDLDRRRDGLFILPPKNTTLINQEMLSFQRMHEHIEYLKRSTQAYVLITQANIAWNIDFNEVLTYHIDSGVDITEIISEKIRLKTFILSRKLLLNYVNKYDILPYKNIFDILEKDPKIKHNTYTHSGYVRYIRDTFNYIKGNLDILRFDIGSTIFKEDSPILSKEKTAPPARYGAHAKVLNSLVSSGAFIDGDVTNSVIGRDVHIHKNTTIKNSVLMSNTIIEEGANINYAILDKGTIVKKDSIIEGSLREPFVSQKEQIVREQSQLSVLHVSSEALPYIKVGGLGDVLGGLTEHLAKETVSTSVIIPLYKKIKEEYESSLKKLFTKVINFGTTDYKVTIYTIKHKKVDYYFVDNFQYFERDDVYGYDDDCDRFAFFNLVVSNIIDDLGSFDIVHLHDWHTALLPILLNTFNPAPPKTLLTLHNIGYQGICPVDVIDKLKLDRTQFKDNIVNFLEIGIKHATKLSTVSPSYRDELRYEEFGGNLTEGLLKRERDFYGILNGIPSNQNPESDTLLPSPYSRDNLTPKTDNKLYLQKSMKLDMRISHFVMGVISRLTEQKGFTIMIPALHNFLARHDDAQFVLLGQGDDSIVKDLEALKARFPKQVTLNIGYDSAVPNYIYAGSDVFLMPSRFEPCGISQMVAMRYGTLPIVHQTGGLADTVDPFDPVTKRGNGFSFYNYDVETMESMLEMAYNVFKNEKNVWHKLMDRAMHTDYSLTRQATKMVELYHLIIEN